MELIQKLLARDRVALARVISLIEDRGADLRKIVDAIYPHTGNSFVLGITGPPGAGKSTVTNKLIHQIRKKGQTVAVLAVDPSSPFSGGAILGDRIRMQSHTGDSGVYIRSAGTRGKHGGLSHSTREVVMALDAASFDWILLETAGVGQTELDVLKVAHGVCVVLVPESGDGIQVMKAGLMEIADLFVVNKSDRPEADKLVKEIVTMIGMAYGEEYYPGHTMVVRDPSSKNKYNDGADEQAWRVPVVKTQALNDVGVDLLFDQISAFRTYVEKSNLIASKQKKFMSQEVKDIVLDTIAKALDENLLDAFGQKLLEEVLQRKISPYDASDRVLKKAIQNINTRSK